MAENTPLPPLTPRKMSRSGGPSAPALPNLPQPSALVPRGAPEGVTNPLGQGVPGQDPNIIVEHLMISFTHDIEENKTAINFMGEGFDAENDQIILDMIEMAASLYGFVLVPEEDTESSDSV